MKVLVRLDTTRPTTKDDMAGGMVRIGIGSAVGGANLHATAYTINTGLWGVFIAQQTEADHRCGTTACMVKTDLHCMALALAQLPEWPTLLTLVFREQATHKIVMGIRRTQATPKLCEPSLQEVVDEQFERLATNEWRAEIARSPAAQAQAMAQEILDTFRGKAQIKNPPITPAQQDKLAELAKRAFGR